MDDYANADGIVGLDIMASHPIDDVVLWDHFPDWHGPGRKYLL